MKVVFIPYENIDARKWDECVQQSQNGLIYSSTAYLNHMCEHWDGLVLDDYSAVMPLTWKKKIGIKYLYQPAFFQQGGISSLHVITDEIKESFLQKAFELFSFAEITLNFANPIAVSHPFFKGTRNNFILHLKESAFQNLNDYVLKRVRRAEKNDLEYRASGEITETVQLYKTLYQERLPEFKNADYVHFENYCKAHPDKCIIRQVVQSGKLVAAVLLLHDGKRLYNIISCILPDGKTILANYFLYYHIIKEFSGTSMVLDFEGSDQNGIAYFYNKFADENQSYPFIKMNRLPAALKLLKP